MERRLLIRDRFPVARNTRLTTEQDALEEHDAPPSRWARWARRLRLPEDGDSPWALSLRPWELPGYGLLIIIGAAMRLWDLGSRAMHHDESLHALYSWNFAEGRGYAHDPMMHGPFQMEATAGVFYVLGDGEFTARLLYAVAGTLLIALPFFLRYRLGRIGALLVSVMLTFSPAMLYFSRFARNDILMSVWVLGLVIAMWRYLDSGRSRYLYIASALLALAFATKENAYFIAGCLGLFLLIVSLARNWHSIHGGVEIGRTSTPAAVGRLVKGAWNAIPFGPRLATVSRPAGFFILLFTLSMPLGAPFIGWLHDALLLGWTRLLLITPDIAGDPRVIFDPGNPNYDARLVDFRYEGLNLSEPMGAPAGGGLVVAVLIAAGLIAAAVYIGMRWKPTVWWRCAAIFGLIWTLAYSSFFTNWTGIASGGWRSAGYWLAQQQLPVARGNQPTYYYVLLTSLYEFLPLILAVAGAVYYLRRRDFFDLFLVFWAGLTFLLYTMAGEKMPWLLVNVALPLIVLAGRFLGDMVERVEWRRLVSGGGLYLIGGVPVTILLLYALVFLDVSSDDPFSLALLAAALGSLAAIAVSGYAIARRVGYASFFAFATIPLAVFLLGLTVRTAWNASYENGDIPVEMLVYTQTTPHVSGLYEHVGEARAQAAASDPLLLTVDDTSGFSWPWAWYLRDSDTYTVSYNSFGASELPSYASESSVLVVHRNNRQKAAPNIGDEFGEGTLVRHRWWFPEHKYRDLSLGTLVRGVADRSVLRSVFEYFLDRGVVFDDIGSEDSYVYFREGFPADFVPRP